MRLDTYLDVSCPWCYVAKRDLEWAVDQLGDVAVEIFRHPYQIDGEEPAEPMPMLTWLAGKYGVDRARQMSQEVTAHARGIGLHLANEAGFAVNTLDAHRMLWLAGREGGEAVQRRLEESLFSAYFVEAQVISDRRVLIDRAGRAGLDPLRAEQVLATGEGVAEVRELVRRGRELTASVPLLILDGGTRLTPGPDREHLLAALRESTERAVR